MLHFYGEVDDLPAAKRKTRKIPVQNLKSKKNVKFILLNKFQLVNDAVWHYNEGKCDPRSSGYGYRKRRQADLDAEFDAIMAEIDDNEFAGKGYGYPSTPLKFLNKLEAVCQKSFKALYNASELADCPKLGAWENRSEEILADLTAMKKVCANGKGSDQEPY